MTHQAHQFLQDTRGFTASCKTFIIYTEIRYTAHEKLRYSEYTRTKLYKTYVISNRRLLYFNVLIIVPSHIQALKTFFYFYTYQSEIFNFGRVISLIINVEKWFLCFLLVQSSQIRPFHDHNLLFAKIFPNFSRYDFVFGESYVRFVYCCKSPSSWLLDWKIVKYLKVYSLILAPYFYETNR